MINETMKFTSQDKLREKIASCPLREKNMRYLLTEKNYAVPTKGKICVVQAGSGDFGMGPWEEKLCNFRRKEEL